MIDGDVYLERFTSIYLQFDLALRAISGFQGSDDAVQTYLGEELSQLRSLLKDAPKSSDFDPEKHWAFSSEGSSTYLSSLKETLPTLLEQVVNRLRQNKLILMVTLLESALKDIHREILRCNNTLLKADRQIPLGKLTSQPVEEIIEEEIEREVQSLDRKSLEQRAEYFDKRLNVSWFDGTIVPLLEPVFNLRNKVLHEDSDAVVSDSDLRLAHIVCLSLPLGCIMQAAVQYPEAFKWGESKFDDMKDLMAKQGRIR